MTSVLSTVNHFFQYLTEDDQKLRSFALDSLLQLVDSHWSEIASILPQLESMYEEKSIQKEKIAILISKVYYHLEEYQESVHFALESGDYFDMKQKSTFVDCIVSKGLSTYIDQRQQNYDNQINTIDPKLDRFFERIFRNSLEQKSYKTALGICLEARRLEKIQEIIQTNDSDELLNYLYELTMKYSSNRAFRLSVIHYILSVYKNKKLEAHEYINFCQCCYFLNEHKLVAQTLLSLIQNDKQNQVLLAFQIAQDLLENENKFFSEKVIETLKTQESSQNLNNLIKILNGQFSQEQNMKFMIENNHSDPHYILQIKEKVEPKQTVAHSAVIFSNALQQAGTTDDKFIREQLEWVSKSSHWAKFNLIASLGVIHQNNHTESFKLLKPYLPQQSGTPKYYEHGGALFALGLIHQKTKNPEIVTYILDQIKNPGNNQNEAIIHGASQALGLLSLASEDMLLYEEMKNILFTNQAVSGEAAAMGIGLLMAGSGNKDIFEELYAYALETTHEKIIRAIALALSALCFDQEENMDALIDKLLLEQDSILRAGGAYCVGMAYCGSSSSKAVQKLLHIISQDVSDDVKRAACISLGFVYLGNGQSLLKISSLLVGSYNAHIRYGICFAMGMSCSGKAHPDALKMVQVMLNDTVDFVRQGAMISCALILQQITEAMDPSVAKFKNDIQEVWSKKQEGVLCKLGAILSSGILQPGGRNAVINLVSKSGNLKLGACMGMLYFTHYWYWFSSVHFLSLALSPSALIGVDRDLNVPSSFSFMSNSKPSLYGYPKNIDPNKDKIQKNAQKIQLSTTIRTQKRSLLRKVDTDKKDEAMVEEKPDQEIKEETQEIEPTTTYLTNPSRVLEKQQYHIQFQQGRFKPIIKNRTKGIVFLIDTQPEEKKIQKMEEEQSQNINIHQNPPDDFIFEEDNENVRLL